MEFIIEKELVSEEEKTLQQLNFCRKQEIKKRLTDARMLYPEFDRHCKENDFEALINLWADIFENFDAVDIGIGFQIYFKTSGENITPAGVVRCIQGLYDD